MRAGTGWQIMGRRREIGGDMGLEGCCGCGGLIYIVGYEVGDRGGGDIVNVGEGGEEEDGCRLFIGRI